MNNNIIYKNYINKINIDGKTNLTLLNKIYIQVFICRTLDLKKPKVTYSFKPYIKIKAKLYNAYKKS